MTYVKFTKNEKIVLKSLQEALKKTKKTCVSKRMMRMFAYDEIKETNKPRAFKSGLDKLLKKEFITEVEGRFFLTRL